jgi:hypothetical protein
MRRSTESEYALGRKSRIGSADGSMPSVSRIGSKTIGPFSSPSLSSPVSSSVPAIARSRSDGQCTVESSTSSPGPAICSSSWNRTGSRSSRSAISSRR